MPWQKKYPGLAGMVGGSTNGPTIAPVGLPQPAQATPSMNHDLRSMAVPNQLPAVPRLAAQPDMNEQVKRKALTNIAMGRKGF